MKVKLKPSNGNLQGNGRNRTTLHPLGGRTIVRYDNDTVVKAGDLRPLPKIHDILYEEASGSTKHGTA